MVERARLELHVPAGERDRIQHQRHPATVANENCVSDPGLYTRIAHTRRASDVGHTAAGSLRHRVVRGTIGWVGDDRFGLRSLDIEMLRRKRCTKWAAARDGYAAWIADMDFPVAPADSRRAASGGRRRRVRISGLGRGRGALAGRPRNSPAHVRAVRLGAVARPRPRPCKCDPGRARRDPPPVATRRRRRAAHAGLLPVPRHAGEDGSPPGAGRVGRRRRSTTNSSTPSSPAAGPHVDPGPPAQPARARVRAVPSWNAIAELAARHDITVIADEVHADLTYAPARHVPFASLGPDVEARTVTLTSASKAFNLAGMRWAVMHVGQRRLPARDRRRCPATTSGRPTRWAWSPPSRRGRAVTTWLDATFVTCSTRTGTRWATSRRHASRAAVTGRPPRPTWPGSTCAGRASATTRRLCSGAGRGGQPRPRSSGRRARATSGSTSPPARRSSPRP